MMINLINLFSVPIFITSLSEEEKITKEELDIFKSMKLNKQYGDDGNHLSDEIHILKKYNLSRIKNFCDNHVNFYVKNILGLNAQFKMFKSWLSMNVEGTKHDAHSHRNTMISCITYFDENLSDEPMTPINFGQNGTDSIFKDFQFQFEYIQMNQYNSKQATVIPKTGTLIIFPGWIRHETEVCQSMTKRYCLGTNYFFNGETGAGYHNMKIEVS